MKKPKNLILLAICMYLVIGTAFLSLTLTNSIRFKVPKVSLPNMTLYEIKPELSEASTEALTESLPETTEAPVETSAPVPKETTAETAAPETITPYYAFSLSGVVSRLHVRTSPSILSDSIGYLPPGTTGIVLELTDSWALIQTPQITGYVFREYLILTELSKEEYQARLQ